MNKYININEYKSFNYNYIKFKFIGIIIIIIFLFITFFVLMFIKFDIIYSSKYIVIKDNNNYYLNCNVTIDDLEKIIPIKNSTEILKYLYDKKYELYIVTNGPSKVVMDKLTQINVQNLIKDIFSAEEADYMKPHREFFDKFFSKCCKNNIFIGFFNINS